MYSFNERSDIIVVDEPLYAHYLSVSGADHPGRDDVIAAMNCDGNEVMSELLQRQNALGTRRLFLKHMAHHLIEIDLSFLDKTQNIFLIRDPRDMLPSLTVQVPHAKLADTGLKRQWQLYEALVSAGQSPLVLDSRELLLDPAGVLAQLCRHIDLAFDDSMLTWKPGPRSADGVWAQHWYHAVHKSRGFSEYQAKDFFPDALRPLLDECQPWYDLLYAQAIRAR